MFSKLLVLATVAAVAVGQHWTHAPHHWTHEPRPDRHDSVSIDEYAATGCAGSPVHHYDVATRQCLPGNGDHNVSSARFECFMPRSGDVCATLAMDAGANCTNLAEQKTVPCGRCMKDERDSRVGYHRMACDAASNSVNVSMGCDEGCRECRESKVIKVGVCDRVHNTRYVELTAVGQCKPTVFEETFSEKDCKGDRHHYVWASGACEGQ